MLASDSFSSFVFSFSRVSVCVWDPNKLFDGGIAGWVGKRKLEEDGGGGYCDGKIWLDGGGDGKLKGKDDGGGGGGGGGGKKGDGGGGMGGGEVLFFLSFNLFNLFLMAKSAPGGPGALFTRSAVRFFAAVKFL